MKNNIISFAKGKDRFVILLPFLGIVIKISHTQDGKMHSIREWLFYKKHRNPFVQPTYFAFCFAPLKSESRCVSIQKIHFRPCKVASNDFYTQLLVLTKGEAWGDCHHFENPENFCFTKKGELRMSDFGSVKTRRIIKKYGAHISRSFDEHVHYSEDDLSRIVESLEHVVL